MPDCRSLCDRRPEPPRPSFARFEEDAVDAYIEEQCTAPVCGACLIVAYDIRVQAARLVAETLTGDRAVHPPKPIDAFRSLKDSRWATTLDFERPPKTLGDVDFYRSSIMDRYSDEAMREVAARERIERDQTRVRLKEEWRVAKAGAPDTNT